MFKLRHYIYQHQFILTLKLERQEHKCDPCGKMIPVLKLIYFYAHLINEGQCNHIITLPSVLSRNNSYMWTKGDASCNKRGIKSFVYKIFQCSYEIILTEQVESNICLIQNLHSFQFSLSIQACHIFAKFCIYLSLEYQ